MLTLNTGLADNWAASKMPRDGSMLDTTSSAPAFADCPAASRLIGAMLTLGAVVTAIILAAGGVDDAGALAARALQLETEAAL
jgi:hypothetical protein